MTYLTPKHEQLSSYILPIVYGSECSVINISRVRVDLDQHLMCALAISMGTESSYVLSAADHGIVQVHDTSAVA